MSEIKSTELTSRIPSLDFLRGIAILGILFINAENFAYPDSWSPYKYGFNGDIDHSTRFWVYFLTQGKFYSMFALLFGVGFYIFLERLEKKNIGLKAMDIYARRLLWLFIIGIVHAYFIWDGDVLYHYAICGFLVFPFRSFKTQYLILVIGILCIVELNLSYAMAKKRQGWQDMYTEAISKPEEERTERDKKWISFWTKKTTKQSSDTTQVEPKRKTYLEGLQETYNHASAHKGTLYYKNIVFKTILLMLVGIVLYRSGIFSDYRNWKYYWSITIGLLAIGFYINYLRYYHWTYEYFELVTNFWKEWLFTFPKEILGIAYILLFNGIYQKFLKNIKLKLVSNIGRTALSNYIFQNILLGLIFYGYGLGQFNQYSRFELIGIILVIWIIQLVLSSWILIKWDKGPLESIWRKLTYKSFKTTDNAK